MDEEKRVIEINGVKMEVDLRTATMIETYRVGDSVKVLKKKYSDYEVLPAAIVGFTEFKKLPTIELLTVDRDGGVGFLAFNAESKEVEIAPFNRYEMAFDRASIMEKLESQIRTKREELRVAEAKQKAFVETFAKVFDLEMTAVEA